MLLLRDLELPDFHDYAVEVPAPTASISEPTRVLGAFLRDVFSANPANLRIMGPDETASNRLGAVFEVTEPRVGRRARWTATITSRPTGG